MQPIVNQVKEAIPGSDDYAIVYPATGVAVNPDESLSYNIFDYIASESEGYAALLSHLEEYVYTCPETKVVLLGYS